MTTNHITQEMTSFLLHWFCTAYAEIFKAPNTSSLGPKPLYFARPHRHIGAQWGGCRTHSETEYSPEQSYRQDKHQGVPLICAFVSPVCQSTPSWPPDSRSSPHTGGHIKLSEAIAARTWDNTHPDAHAHGGTHSRHTCAQTHVHTYSNTETDQMGPGAAWWLGGHIQ